MGLTFNMVTSSSSKTKPPVYTYLKADGTAANCELIDEGNGNFMLKLLESGTLNISKLNSAKDGIDVLLVGGGKSETAQGGNGQKGGEVITAGSIAVAKDQTYSITVGDVNADSVAFGNTARAGYGSSPGTDAYVYANVSDTGAYYETSRRKATKGTDGVDPWGIGTKFGAGGGGKSFWTMLGYQVFSEVAGAPGDDSGDNTGCAGFSGIVIIRNHRA